MNCTYEKEKSFPPPHVKFSFNFCKEVLIRKDRYMYVPILHVIVVQSHEYYIRVVNQVVKGFENCF